MAPMSRPQALTVAEWFTARGFKTTVALTPPDTIAEPPTVPSYAVTGVGVIDSGSTAVSRLQALVAEAESRGLVAEVTLTLLVRGT